MLRNIAMMQRFALNQLNAHHTSANKHMERLSSGLRINRAADDAAGLAISEKMRAQIRGLQQAQRNVLDGQNLIRTAEGGLNEQHLILQRMRELSVQSSNGTYSDSDRKSIQLEVDELLKELVAIRENSEFNTKKLSQGGTLTLQTGANSGQSMTIELPDTSLENLGLSNLSLETQESAEDAIKRLDDAISIVSSNRSRFGAYENRLGHTYNHLSNYELQLSSSESRIRDADMAKEMMGMLKHTILKDFSMMILMQANQQQSMVLKLLQ